jgi:hypothetical protein
MVRMRCIEFEVRRKQLNEHARRVNGFGNRPGSDDWSASPVTASSEIGTSVRGGPCWNECRAR